MTDSKRRIKKFSFRSWIARSPQIKITKMTDGETKVTNTNLSEAQAIIRQSVNEEGSLLYIDRDYFRLGDLEDSIITNARSIHLLPGFTASYDNAGTLTIPVDDDERRERERQQLQIEAEELLQSNNNYVGQRERLAEVQRGANQRLMEELSMAQQHVVERGRTLMPLRYEDVKVKGGRLVRVAKNILEFHRKGDDEVREFREFGLFPKGIKKFKALPYEEQIKKIRVLKEVSKFNSKKKEALVKLGKNIGTYEIKIRLHPRAFRRSYLLESWQNPFICMEDNHICLGNMERNYLKCWENNNYLECLKILCAVLKSNNTKRAYRQWDDCKIHSPKAKKEDYEDTRFIDLDTYEDFDISDDDRYF